MTKLTTEERHELPNYDFAYIDSSGNRHLPIQDAEHVRDALSRWPRTEFENSAAKDTARSRILAAAKEYGVDVSPTDKIARGEHD